MKNGFWIRVNKDGPLHPVLMTKCWLWLGMKDRKGYGRLDRGVRPNRRTIGAHRYSFEEYFGSIEGSIDVLHACDNPACVNPEHLFLGTDEDNKADMMSKNRQARGERSGPAKLTESAVREIRFRYRHRHPINGITPLSKEFGVSTGAIKHIVKMATWRHVET